MWRVRTTLLSTPRQVVCLHNYALFVCTRVFCSTFTQLHHGLHNPRQSHVLDSPSVFRQVLDSLPSETSSLCLHLDYLVYSMIPSLLVTNTNTNDSMSQTVTQSHHSLSAILACDVFTCEV